MSITQNVWFTSGWWLNQYGIECKNPMETSPEEQIEITFRKNKVLFEKFGHLGLGQEDPEPTYTVPQYDGRIVVASAFGGDWPSWEKESACYWYDKSDGVLGSITNATDIAKIKIPDWDNNPLLQETFERFSKDKTTSYFKEAKVSYPWSIGSFYDYRTDLSHDSIAYISVVDLAPFLYGDTGFFSIIMEDEDIAFALLDKCYEISTSFSEYNLKQFGIDASNLSWSSIGGDYSCVMSPALYRKYIKPYDLRRNMESRNKYINLHSCGASSHLYDVWSEYPDKESILFMQTRGIEGRLAHLRSCLPHTLIQLTMHLPQFDFENVPQCAVERIVRSYANEAGYENLTLCVLVTNGGENSDRNIETLFRTVGQINQEMQS